MSEIEVEPRATPPQYQAKVFKVWALQYIGTNKTEVLAFASSYLYETPEGELMIIDSPIELPVNDWVIQWSNTGKRGVFECVSNSVFGLTWLII